jgi:uroporphyrinogen-III decarboxylase
MGNLIPIVLFAYARPDHLQHTLNCLKADQVPLIIAFSDAPNLTLGGCMEGKHSKYYTGTEGKIYFK